MEASFNNGSYFFDITSPDLKLTNSVTKLITDDVVQLAISEEIGKLTTGTLTVRDNAHDFSRIFRQGIKFDISWGYKKWDPLQGMLNNIRTGLECVVQTPSGRANESGEVIYTVTFYALEFLSGKQHRVFDTGTKGTLITQLLADMEADEIFISFAQQKDRLDTENSIRQDESSFALLVELSRRWKCHFHIGYKPNGKKAALFIDSNKVKGITAKAYVGKIVNIIDKDLFYNDFDNSNVRSYDWKQHIGESGQGSNIEVRYINGQVVFIRRVAEVGRVTAYKINPGKIAARFQGKNIKETMELTRNLLSTTEFDQVKWAFDAVEESTAPEGLGFTINVKMMGDPRLTVPLSINFKKGFPSVLAEDVNPFTRVNEYFALKTTHTISKTGYFTDLQIVDSFAVNGTAIAQRQNIE